MKLRRVEVVGIVRWLLLLYVDRLLWIFIILLVKKVVNFLGRLLGGSDGNWGVVLWFNKWFIILYNVFWFVWFLLMIDV